MVVDSITDVVIGGGRFREVTVRSCFSLYSDNLGVNFLFICLFVF